MGMKKQCYDQWHCYIWWFDFIFLSYLKWTKNAMCKKGLVGLWEFQWTNEISKKGIVIFNIQHNNRVVCRCEYIYIFFGPIGLLGLVVYICFPSYLEWTNNSMYNSISPCALCCCPSYDVITLAIVLRNKDQNCYVIT
jgi:hypothetical protein